MDVNAAKALIALAKAKRERKLFQFTPYPWQIEFGNASADHRDLMLIAANRVGKTYTAAHVLAFHLTGLYPEWWKGRRFAEPITAWACGISNESLREIIQKELFGGMGEELGTGAIPKDCIVDWETKQGVPGVIDFARIRHVSGGESRVVQKSYEQGWQKFQGAAIHVAWLDEDPNDQQLFTEVVTRLMTKRGLLMVTFTPLLGLTPMLRHFYSLKDKVYIKNVTWDDAPHLSEQDKSEMLEKYPEHERDARSKGVPMRGEGVVFPFPESSIKCAAFSIPRHWTQIIGIDFGHDHPAATVKLAIDTDNDVVYVVDAHRDRKMGALGHSDRIKRMGGGLHTGMLPVAYPHDGLGTEKTSGKQIIETYREYDLNLLSMTARYDDDVGGGQSREKNAMEIYDRIKSCRFKVFDHLSDFFEEYRNYHRKDGKIVPIMDDILSATFYAYMMRRYAMAEYMLHGNMGQDEAPISRWSTH